MVSPFCQSLNEIQYNFVLIIFLENQHVLHTVQKHIVYLKISSRFRDFISSLYLHECPRRRECLQTLFNRRNHPVHHRIPGTPGFHPPPPPNTVAKNTPTKPYNGPLVGW